LLRSLYLLSCESTCDRLEQGGGKRSSSRENYLRHLDDATQCSRSANVHLDCCFHPTDSDFARSSPSATFFSRRQKYSQYGNVFSLIDERNIHTWRRKVRAKLTLSVSEKRLEEEEVDSGSGHGSFDFIRTLRTTVDYDRPQDIRDKDLAVSYTTGKINWYLVLCFFND